MDNELNEAYASDNETVTVTDVMPVVALDKTVDPATLAEPGGVFTFKLTITNNSVEEVTITALTDSNALSLNALLWWARNWLLALYLLHLCRHSHRSLDLPEHGFCDGKGQRE